MLRKRGDKSEHIYKYWKNETSSFLYALNYFRHNITKFSPNKIIPKKDPKSKYDRYVLDINKSILVSEPLDHDILKDMSVDALSIYENHSKLRYNLEFGNILGKGIQGVVYEMFLDYDGHYHSYALKRMPIIDSRIYTKHVLLEEYWSSVDFHDRWAIFNEIMRHLKNLSEEEKFYFEYEEFSHLRRIITDLTVTKMLFPTLADHERYKRELEELRKFYKYVCLNNIILPFSDANNDVIISYHCSKLVLEKMSPSFPLLYCSFKTNHTFPFRKEEFNLCKDIQIKCGDNLKRRIYPQQFMAMEKLDMTLHGLITSEIFDIKTQDIQLVCERYFQIYTQIILALLTAQKKYGYVNNDLHLNNIMIKKFKGPIYYVVNENDLRDAHIIFPVHKFPRDKNGDILLELKVDVGLCKIIDNGRATLNTHNINVGSNTDIFNARYCKVENYNPRNFNNDLLKFFITIYDEDFFNLLFDRYEKGVSSDLEKKILCINSEIFYCHNDEKKKKDVFDIFEECGSNKQCNDMFYYFGMFGFGDKPRCEIKDQRKPDNLIKYLNHLCKPKIKHKKLKMCFRMA